MLQAIKKLGIDYDKPVRQWKKAFEPKQTSGDHSCESAINLLQESLVHNDSECSDSAVDELDEDEPMNSESDEGEGEAMKAHKTLGSSTDVTPDPENPLCTYTIVGDNVDKNIKPRDMRIDKQVTSMHAFHMYATKDRVDASSLPDDKPVRDLEAVPISTFMPSIGDSIILRENYLVSRVLVKHLKYFSSFTKCVPEHIEHEHSAEMAKKSEIVSTTF